MNLAVFELFPCLFSLLRRHHLGSSRNLLPHEPLLKRMGTFLTLCSKRSAREQVEITEEPIDAWLLFNRKPTIRCDRTTPNRVINFPTFLITYGKQIPNPCFVYGRN